MVIRELFGALCLSQQTNKQSTPLRRFLNIKRRQTLETYFLGIWWTSLGDELSPIFYKTDLSPTRVSFGTIISMLISN